jgi:general stress protein 26
MNNPPSTVAALLDKATSAIISSVDAEGFPNTKAMLPPRHRSGIRELYFTTNTSSMRVRQYAVNPKACVYFYDSRSFVGVMLKGTMEVLHDDATKQLIWRDGDEMYYPKGVTDADYCVLRFTATGGRWYGNFKSGDFTVG